MTIEQAQKIEQAYLAGDESAKCFEPFAAGGEPAENVMERAMSAAQDVIDAQVQEGDVA